jgi:hypothetical protein
MLADLEIQVPSWMSTYPFTVLAKFITFLTRSDVEVSMKGDIEPSNCTFKDDVPKCLLVCFFLWSLIEAAIDSRQIIGLSRDVV